MQPDQAVTILEEPEVHAFLQAHRFGRLALVRNDQPHIFPVNFAAQLGDSDHVAPTIYIRTAAGDKFFAASVEQKVAFEVDDVQEGTATSVMVTGVARVVEGHEELERVNSLGLQPWTATWKPSVIAIDVTQITGRTFLFGPEPDVWTGETPD